MNGRHVHTTAVCVSVRWSGLREVWLPAGSWRTFFKKKNFLNLYASCKVAYKKQTNKQKTATSTLSNRRNFWSFEWKVINRPVSSNERPRRMKKGDLIVPKQIAIRKRKRKKNKITPFCFCPLSRKCKQTNKQQENPNQTKPNKNKTKNPSVTITFISDFIHTPFG